MKLRNSVRHWTMVREASLRGKSVRCRIKVNKAPGTFTTEEISVFVGVTITWVKCLKNQQKEL